MFTKHFLYSSILFPYLYIIGHFCMYIGKSCGEPDSPGNGRVNTSAGTSFGDVAKYSCDTGYTLNVPAERTCQADGHWNGSIPTCESEILGCHA